MFRKNVFYLIAFLLSLSSISYELILAQSLSAFLENTVLRYSVTIGVYMCSLGVGSLWADDKWTKRAVVSLLKIEVLLTILGGFSVVLLFLADAADIGRAGFMIISHSLIILIGILSGFEIPLIVKIANKHQVSSVNQVLSANYAGAFLGTVVFAFYLYPKLGILSSAFLVGIVNAVSGLLLYFEEHQLEEGELKNFYKLLYILLFLFLSLVLCVIFAEPINQFFIHQYLLK